MMKPYFETHPAGLLYVVVILCWYGIELRQFTRQRQWRQEATTVAPRAYRVAFWVCVIATGIAVYLLPHIAPGANLGPGALVFAIGMVVLLAGMGLRWWAFRALGQYFTFTVKVSQDQPVVTAGPYRVLRHPGYAGGLLAIIGIGIVYENWISVVVLAIGWSIVLIWRIRIEEKALMTSLDSSYSAYAAHHKRLVPFLW